MHILNVILGMFQALLGIALILIIAIQQSKSEGLGGAITGKPTSSFKGKPGFEERLTEMTKYISIAFFVVSIAVATTMGR